MPRNIFIKLCGGLIVGHVRERENVWTIKRCD